MFKNKVIWCFALLFWLNHDLVWAQLSKPTSKPLPQQTPLSDCHVDKDGVQAFRLPSGEVVYNIFEVASQAMSGNASCIIYGDGSGSGLLPRIVDSDNKTKLAPHEAAALRWLIDHAEETSGGALVWRYKFDNAYNDIEIRSPWASAFGQAHVIKAFISAFKKTGNVSYKDYAARAADAFKIPIESGGFKAVLPDGSVFFEEVPTNPPSHILNGHLISVISLLEAADNLKRDDLRLLAESGLETLKKHLDLYDVGYWSRYDLNPKRQEIIFRFDVDLEYPDEALLADFVDLKNTQSGRSVRLDIGAEDDALGSVRISGIEWGQSSVNGGYSVRPLLNGRSRHLRAVKGGSRQNSYFILALPDLMFQNYVDVPSHELIIGYVDVAKSNVRIQVQDINHGNIMEFVDLPCGLELNGDGRHKTSKCLISPKYFAWYMGVEYQKYHVQLLLRLYELTGDVFLLKYANSWAEYIVKYDGNSK